MLKRYHFFLYFVFLTHITVGQTPSYSQFTINNGLPSNTIYDIIQDENGFIWFATDYGVSKYDGISFTNYTISDGLPDNEVLSLFKDSKNRIWLIGFNGKIGYIQNYQFYNNLNSTILNDLKSSSYISYIIEDSHNNIWFLESIKKISKLDTLNKITKYDLGVLKDENEVNNLFLAEDKFGNVNLCNSILFEDNKSILLQSNLEQPKWVKFRKQDYNSNSILKLTHHKTEALKCIESTSEIISNAIINQFNYPLKNNSIYNNTKVNGHTFLITNLQEGALIIDTKQVDEKPVKLLPKIRTTRSFIDLENNIWIGSLSNGAYLFPNINISGIQFENNKGNDIHTVSIFNNKLIIGNELGEINIINKENLKTENILKLNNFPERTRHLKVSNDKLYIASDKNIHQLNSNFSLTRVKNMFDKSYQKTKLKNFKDISVNDNFMYAATSNGIAEINKITFETSRKWDKRCSAILAVNDSIWVGTTSGLYLFNHTIEEFDLNNHFNNSIIYALEKVDNCILIGSNSYGLGILNNGRFKFFDTNDGLLSNYVKSITIDSNNTIWLSTNFGLNSLILDKNNEISSIKSYTTSDGLYSNDVRDCFIDNIENKVYVATSRGLNIIDLSDNKTSILPPILHINDVLVNNISIDKNSNDTFDFNENNFQFTFSGISFKSLGNITFKYKLEGLEEEWITTKNNTVRYSSLPPGDYIFKLKAISKNNVESEDAVCFGFTISPPFYMTWWFRTILGLILISILYLISNLRKKRRQKEQKIKEQISMLQYRALNAQMNPHFINNLIININSLANKGELENVKNCLGKFGELVNLVLNTTKSNLISLKDELEMSKLYLDLEIIRFNKKIEYSINFKNICEDDLDSILVPPMILQPIIENAIKHGFKNSLENNTIAIHLKTEGNDFLICEIIDNGSGIEQKASVQKSKNSGISLENINKRLQLINENQSEEKFVFITNLSDEFNNLEGSKITLKIPLISF